MTQTQGIFSRGRVTYHDPQALLALDEAVGVHHTDTSDGEWDSNGNRTRLLLGQSASYYRKAFAWADPDGDPTTKDAYSGHHHEVDADGVIGAANLRACRLLIGNLNGGGRGWGTIPESEHLAVWQHLAAHIRDSGSEPPPLKDTSTEDALDRILAGYLNRNAPRRGPQRQSSGSEREWYRIQNATTDDETEIWIYDEIGYWGITASDFVRDMRNVSTSKITLHLNSPGGDVFDGIAIYSVLKRHPATVTVYVDALAASVASIIAMAGDRVLVAPHSTMMIHDPFAFVIGNEADLRKEADVLGQLGNELASIYAERAGGKTADWRATMLEETWYTDRQAVDAGLADGIDGEPGAVAHFDLSRYRHVPENLVRQARGEPTIRDAERALRDVGMSHAAAKKVLARGWDEEPARDVPGDAPNEDPEPVEEPTTEPVEVFVIVHVEPVALERERMLALERAELDLYALGIGV